LATIGSFQEELERQWAGSARYHTRLALAIVDLDDFGKVNDAEGHAGGDPRPRRCSRRHRGRVAAKRRGLPDRR
jgi:predicted signal transduction protein with EAL and GGDEF domain